VVDDAVATGAHDLNAACELLKVAACELLKVAAEVVASLDRLNTRFKAVMVEVTRDFFCFFLYMRDPCLMTHIKSSAASPMETV
jgi:predicted phosphoribosyltransferase